VEIAIPLARDLASPDPLTGEPPARSAHELAALMRSCGASAPVLTATAAWLSGERRQSPHTQAGYITDLSRWAAWCQMRGQDLASVPATEADLFAAAMRSAGLQEATRARRLSAVSSWFAYLMRAEAAPVNPFGEGMERPKQPDVSKTRGMSEDQLDRLLACARERESPRTFALLTLMASTACRVSSATRGVLMAPGDILPVVQEALKTAIRFWEPAEEIADCATCGPGDALGAMCSAHAADRVKADRYRDALIALTGT
jgi:hypothetical protein